MIEEPEKIIEIEKYQKIWNVESISCFKCGYLTVKVFPIGINPNFSKCNYCNYLYNQELITSFFINRLSEI